MEKSSKNNARQTIDSGSCLDHSSLSKEGEKIEGLQFIGLPAIRVQMKQLNGHTELMMACWKTHASVLTLLVVHSLILC